MKRKKVKTSGEAFVWLTGMGLTVGVSMVIGLMIVIFINGFAAFWPSEVSKIKTKNGIELGEIVLDQKKKGNQEEEEIQIFRGNKEVYGEAFYFIDKKDILSISKPSNQIMIERMEYGDAIGKPLKLKLKDEGIIEAGSPIFDKTLSLLVNEAVDRWDAIYDLEKITIGSINKELEDLKHLKRRYEAEIKDPSLLKSKISQIEEKESKLVKKYEGLASQAKTLRQKQNSDYLSYELIDGQKKEIPIGQIVHYYYPNQLDFQNKLSLFLHNIWSFLSKDPREANTEGGIFPALFGTFVMTLLMSLAVTPFGILAAIYLREYAKQGPWVRMVRIAVNNLAGVPSIVFGVFGLGFFVYLVGGSIDKIFFWDRLPTPTFGTGGLLWASLTLALMTVPVVIVATEEALSAVSRGVREAAYGCGSSKWQMIYRVVLPAAAPGILTGMILAMARGAGEVAPLMLVGVVKLAPTLPINGIFPFIHLDQKFMHLGFHIFDLGFQSPDAEAAKPMVFATTLLLIVVVIVLNLGAIWLREKLRRKYVSGAF